MEFRSFLLYRMVVICCLYFNFRSHAAAAPTLLRNETDRLSLMAFKAAITNDPFGVLSSWNDSLHFCHWVGVSCSNRHKQRVVSLNLENKELGGVLSPHVGNLSFLKVFNVSNNKFTGEIPDDLGRLFRLQVLQLANNTLEGRIPVKLSNCSSIEYLNLRGNTLQGRIPIQLGSLEKLKYVELRSNNLTGSIPSSLGNLSSLETFNLQHNNFVGAIPEGLAQLRHLSLFALNDNLLSGVVPPQLYNLSNIRIFSLSRNQQLQGTLPLHIGDTLPGLEWFGVGRNQFTGIIPASLLNCSKLMYLEIQKNMFTTPLPQNLGRLLNLEVLLARKIHFGSGEGPQSNDLQFLSSLTNCTNLQIVDVRENGLIGSLPVSIANLSSQLEWLSLGTNYIHGHIPSGIGNLLSLNFLSLSENNISGHIPNTFGKLQRLQELYLYGNKLTGRIPSSLGNFTQLSILYIDNNNFNGSIPSGLGNCQSLIGLDLSANKLTGTIPIQLFNLHSLSYILNLGHNYLTGPLPVQIGNLKNLEQFSVSDNKLSGDIPPTLGECKSLSQVLMQGNIFEGKIPESLSALRGLEGLNLSHNKLAGIIPKFLGDLPFLSILDLSFNDLEGAVPEGKFGNVSVFKVDGNPKLCGGISKLRLPVCPTLDTRRRPKSLHLKILVPIIVASLFLAIFALFVVMLWKRRMSTKSPSTSLSWNFRLLRISYAELVKATDSFSDANLLGVGTYSSVYKGILDRDGMIVAVKVLNLEQQGGSKSFKSECEALRRVRHRNLVKILTSCSSMDFQGNAFKALVFEFMPNGNLEKWLYSEADEQCRRRTTRFSQRLNIAIDVASALDHLHNHSQPTIVHCDLKPSNVLLDSEMTAHVGDFGLAKILSSVSDDLGQSQTSSLAIKGSIGYVAPEYSMGSEVSTQGDAYSYGILLLEMFTGKRPTDDMFRDGLSLHKFANMSLPEKVVEIVDPRLVEEEGTEGRIQECFVAVLKIGVMCSMESPKDRMQMGNVIKELSSVRGVYHDVGFQS